MKKPVISITVITHNRKDYTEKTLVSLIKNTKIPYELFVVDNASTDRTQGYLETMREAGHINGLILNKENLYPGEACNQGWQLASKSAKFMMRSDNDIVYNPGWDKTVIEAFQKNPHMGQLGLVNELFQVFPSSHKFFNNCKVKIKGMQLYKPMNLNGNVGGPCVIRRKLYDEGIRWHPDKWDTSMNEDIEFSLHVKGMGYEIYELPLGVVDHIGFGDFQKYPEYYYEKYKRRGLIDWFTERLNYEKAGKIKNGRYVD